jgi:hypothetical protein
MLAGTITAFVGPKRGGHDRDVAHDPRPGAPDCLVALINGVLCARLERPAFLNRGREGATALSRHLAATRQQEPVVFAGSTVSITRG